MLFARYSDLGFYFTPSQSPMIDFVARHRLFAVGASSPKMVLFSLVTFLTGEQCCGSIFERPTALLENVNPSHSQLKSGELSHEPKGLM
jgi:hypothetical protein